MGSNKPKVSDQYEDLDGTIRERASIHDFGNVRARIFTRILNRIGNENADRFVLPAINSYNVGHYAEALESFDKATRLFSIIQDEITPHMNFCRKVLSVPLDKNDLAYDQLLADWNRKPALLRWFFEKVGSSSVPTVRLRCKWCGHFTPFIDPNHGWAYFSQNNCIWCRRGYPMPDFAWDSLDGQAYTYYRGSVTEPEFYQEFEEKYEVSPVMRVVDHKWVRMNRSTD